MFSINGELKVGTLRNILEAIHDVVFVLNKEAEIVYVNYAYTKLLKVPTSKIIGKKLTEIEPNARILDVLENGHSVVNEPTRIKSVGADIVASINPLFENNEVVGAVAIFRDKSEVINLQDKIRKLREEVETKNNLSQIYYSELKQLRKQLLSSNDFVFESKAMKETVELALEISSVDTTVLITGESGVGKNIIAKLMHSNSPRSEKAFIQINCGAIPHNLLESELFGYEKGAFTGALREGKAGLIEIADGGTLFLDEIGELPLDSQVKLLRVIQEQELLRIGSLKPKKINVRFISATNKNLESLIAKGVFREDLYYRLNVVPISVPPLRERIEEIPLLINHFSNKCTTKHKKEPKTFDMEVISLFESYEWPGNIRQLENLVERLVVSTPYAVINIQNKYLREFFQKNIASKDIVTVNDILPLKAATEILEKILIRRTLKKHKTLRRAASVLKIDHSTLARKAKKYEIIY